MQNWSDADSESDSDDEIVEKNPPQEVLEEPTKMRRKMLDLIQIRSVLTAAGPRSSNKNCNGDGSRVVNISRDSQAISRPRTEILIEFPFLKIH